MERLSVKGIGGVLLFADHADTLAHWYERHLGLFFTREPGSHEWWCELPGTSFAIHQARPALGRDRRNVEITWRVADLDALTERLAELGAPVVERQETPDGDFAWFTDPEGNRIALCQDRDSR